MALWQSKLIYDTMSYNAFRQKRQQGLNNGRLTSTMTGYVKIVPNTDNGRSQCLLYRKRHASNEVTLNLCPST